MNRHDPFLGIDFGTANSAMAWVNPTTGHVEIVCNAEGDEKTRTAVFFGAEHTHVGRLAEELLEHEDDAEFVLLSAKLDLARQAPIALPDGRMKTAHDVAATILAKLRQDAESSLFHESVRRTVITVPAIFDPLERKQVIAAAHVAGFEIVELLDEPVAAAIAYLHSGQKVGKRVLVYDLGAGTFDAAVLDHDHDELKPFRLALPPNGLRFGGDDLDGLLWNYLLKFANGDAETIRSNPSLRKHMLHRCRRLKENLSSLDSDRFTLPLPNGSKLQRDVTREEFESVICGCLDETIRLTANLFATSGESGSLPDTLVLIGGSSRIPLIGRLLSKAIPLVPRSWHRQDVAVALGAAIYADGIWGHKRNRIYRDALKHARRSGQLPANRLSGLRDKLELAAAEADNIESEELGETLATLLAKSHAAARDKYEGRVGEVRRRLTDATVRQLQHEARQFGLSPEQAAEVERRLLGDSKERLLEREQSQRQSAAETFVAKAENLRREGKLDEALDQAQLACDRSPNLSVAHFVKGQILYDLGKIELAESAFGLTVDLSPEHRDAYFGRGRCRLLLGREQEALIDFDVVIDTSPSADALWYRAIAHQRAGYPGAAAGDLFHALSDRQALEADCGFPALAATTVLGMLLLRELSQPAESVKWLTNALRMIRFDKTQSSWAILAEVARFFGDPALTASPRPSDILVRLLHKANVHVMETSADGILVGGTQLALWEACHQVDGPTYKHPLNRFHAMCAELTLPIHCLMALRNEALGLNAVGTLAQAGDDVQTLQFIDWLIQQFDVDVCKMQADDRVKNRPQLRQALTPCIAVEENHGMFYNFIVVTNMSLFSVHDVRVEATVTREDRKKSTITRSVQQLGTGKRHRWENVFQDGGFFGSKIKSVSVHAFCRQGGESPVTQTAHAGICPKCGFSTPALARQCLTCGADWHFSPSPFVKAATSH